MSYSHAEKEKKIILDNFKYSTKQVELKKLKKTSGEWKIPLFTFHNLVESCGDTLHLLIKIKDNYIEQIYFSGQQSCLITISSSNILCSYLENKNLETAWKIITNFQTMLEGKTYCLDVYPQLEVFSSMPNFPHRLECVNLVLRGVIHILQKAK